MTELNAPRACALVIYRQVGSGELEGHELWKAFPGKSVEDVRAEAQAWAVRNLGPEAIFQIVVLPKDGTRVTDTTLQDLSDIPRDEREHSLFRKAYNLGYYRRAKEGSRAVSHQRDRQSAREGAAAVIATFDVTSGGLLDRLAPGVRVVRDLTEMTEDACSTETPCCGRRIALPGPVEHEARPAVCCRCRIVYQVAVVREESEGYDDEPSYVAVFLTEHLDVATAQHRAGKWEQTKMSRRRTAD